MKALIMRIKHFLKRSFLVFRSLKKIYKYGGYTTVKIATITHGEILKGKKILITGGSSGIGLSIAQKCLSEGATIVITGRNKEKLEKVFQEENNPNLKILEWDISELGQIEDRISKTNGLLGGEIDVLVNNAGIINGTNFPNVTTEIWDKIYAVNSKGLFFVTQFIVKRWIANNKIQTKKIINISSQGGFVGATYPYRMTKWDIAGLTQGLGIRLAPLGIIVNGIAPGIIATKMQPNFLQQNENIYCPLTPVERFATPEEIAELAIFLISDASNFIVGQTIVCDGGYSIK